MLVVELTWLYWYKGGSCAIEPRDPAEWESCAHDAGVGHSTDFRRSYQGVARPEYLC